MGKKIRPNSFRLGILKDWDSRWYPKKSIAKVFLEEDVAVREAIYEKLGLAGIDQVVIERAGNNIKVLIKAAKPGLIIGRGGKGIEDLAKIIEKQLKKIRKEKGINEPVSLNVSIEELKRQEISAKVIAQNITRDIERRMPFRRLMKRTMEQIMQNREVKGAKIRMAGRLDGGEIARSEQLAKGTLPLQNLRANIDYGEATAFTTYGTVGIKVWINKGEVFKDK